MTSNSNQPKYNQLNFVTTNRFYVEISKEITASFTECSGLSLQIKKNVFREGGVNDQQRIYLGQTEFTDITLKRGISDSLIFWNWINELYKVNDSDKDEPVSRRNVNILVFNQSGETMMSWTLIGAVPIGWKTPTLQADGNAVAIEELTIAYEGLSMSKKQGGGNSVTRRDVDSSFPSN
jgi:phage tail-like protein